MEPGNDSQLKRLLREWQVPNAPDALEQRVLGPLGQPRPWWWTLMSSRVRVPLPVAIAFSIAFVWLTVLVVGDREPPSTRLATTYDLRGFQPVDAVSVRIERSSDATR